MAIQFHWYGFMYVAAFWLGWLVLPRLGKWRNTHLNREEWTEIVVWSAVGVLAGGRLGYVVLYEPTFYLQHVSRILAVWEGGMSSHGGFIGVALALWYVSRKFRLHLLQLSDIAVVPVAVGLALGRFGNFINHELYVGNFALAAVAKDVLIAAVCYLLLRRMPALRDGKVTGIFLVMYAALRFLTEYVRVQEWEPVWGLTRGQLFTIPLLVVGIYLLFARRASYVAR